MLAKFPHACPTIQEPSPRLAVCRGSAAAQDERTAQPWGMLLHDDKQPNQVALGHHMDTGNPTPDIPDPRPYLHKHLSLQHSLPIPCLRLCLCPSLPFPIFPRLCRHQPARDIHPSNDILLRRSVGLL